MTRRPGGRRRAADPRGRWPPTCGPATTRSTWPRPARRRWPLAAEHHPDVVVLDLGLPGHRRHRGGRAACAAGRRCPIIVLSVRDDEADKVDALDAGADDYVTKPFGMDELLARAPGDPAARARPTDEPVVETQHFTIDLAAKRATAGGAEDVHLTPTEWHLRRGARAQPGRLVLQRQLLQEVWGPQYEKETDYLRVHMAPVRRKLEPDPGRPRHFLTEPGMGYRFEPGLP